MLTWLGSLGYLGWIGCFELVGRRELRMAQLWGREDGGVRRLIDGYPVYAYLIVIDLSCGNGACWILVVLRSCYDLRCVDARYSCCEDENRKACRSAEPSLL